MNFFSKAVIITIAALLAAQASAAVKATASEVFTCDLVQLTKGGWIPSKVSLQFLENRKTARIWTTDDDAYSHTAVHWQSVNSILLDWTPSRAVAAKSADLSNDHYRVVFNESNLKLSFQVRSGFSTGQNLLQVLKGENCMW